MGQNLCAPCRGSTMSDSLVRCDCCGIAATDSGIEDWAAVGRWHMVCPQCVPAIGALPVGQFCDNCNEPATRVTADGSNACLACMDTFSQQRVWLARAQELVTRAQRRMSITPLTPELERQLWLHAAGTWARGDAFCGNSISWRDICTVVEDWWHRQGMMIQISGLTASADRYSPAWKAAVLPPPPRKQSTLTQQGFTGRRLAVTRP